MANASTISSLPLFLKLRSLIVRIATLRKLRNSTRTIKLILGHPLSFRGNFLIIRGINEEAIIGRIRRGDLIITRDIPTRRIVMGQGHTISRIMAIRNFHLSRSISKISLGRIGVVVIMIKIKIEIRDFKEIPETIAMPPTTPALTTPETPETARKNTNPTTNSKTATTTSKGTSSSLKNYKFNNLKGIRLSKEESKLFPL
jgi:hypothetical protein